MSTRRGNRAGWRAALAAALVGWGCQAAPAQPVACDPDDGGLKLPEEFCALVVADGIEGARHLVVAENGDLFVAIEPPRPGGPGGVAALRDTTGDGRADVVVRFGKKGGTGIALRGGWLWMGADDEVIRFPLPTGALEPSGPGESVVAPLPALPYHAAKSLAFGADGALYVNIGSPSNSCQVKDREPGSVGKDPCEELETRAGIWRFESAPGQTQEDGERFATGLRNTVALAFNPADGELYGVVHGRDQLHTLWPELFSAEQSAERPSEEFVRIRRGDDFGWPYCYHDPGLGLKVLAPEYGGDGRRVGRCSAAKDPLLAFPAHWAPDGLLFYAGTLFPPRYRGGAFIAFHGSWNRAPLPEQGYLVAFLPFTDGAPGEWEVFADGFAGGTRSPRQAEHRPVGLAEGPDGSLYISDDEGGRIWRVLPRR